MPMPVHSDITEKSYRKLVLQISLDGFSYCSIDTLNQSVITLNEINFAQYQRNSKAEDHYWKAFVDHRDLTRNYDDVMVIHSNNLNTFVPKELFDEEYLGSYLQYNTKVFETDFFDFDELPNYEINNVYIPYVHINNFLIDQFGSFDYRNANTILVSKLLEISKNNWEKLVFVHFAEGRFELVVVQNQKLLFFNSFEFRTKEDFLYFLLFSAEQLNLDPETFHLQFLGKILEGDPCYQMAYKYVRNVSMFDVSELEKSNNLTTIQNLQHFILLQP